MALYRNRLQEAKTARIQNEWPKIDQTVFKKLRVTPNKLADLEQGLVGYIVLPGMPDYDKDRQETMLTPYSAYPQIIVYCKVINDVKLCLEWAHMFKWWVTCRSGGHSFAGYSVNSGMVIDLSNMNYVVVDAQNKQARIGPGAQFQQINPTLTTYGLHLPGGTCPDVACAGYMQGGGYGLTSRRFGIHCDSVLEVTMMLHDGSIVVANATQNQKLLWAVCGGTGNNFGVLLETKYQLYDLADVWGFGFMWDIEQAPAVLRELQANYMRTGKDTKLGTEPVLAMYPDGKTQQFIPKLVVLGLYQGTEQAGTNAMKSLLAIGKPQRKFSKIGTYADLNEDVFSVLPGIPTNPPQPMVTRSGYVSDPVDIKTWEAICKQFATTPNQWNILGIEPYGGAISAYPKDGNAFVHRDVDMNLFVFAFLEQGKEKPDQQWLDGMATTLGSVWNGQVYQNYPVRDFGNFRWAYWGDAFNTLLDVKHKYDPENFFRFEQSISPHPQDQTIQRSKAPSKFKNKKIIYEKYSKK